MVEKELEEIAEKLEEENSKSQTCKLRSLLSKVNNRVLESNGFMTSKGKYICKSEWHAVAIPAGMISASYMLPEPLGLLTFLSWLLMNKKGFDLLQSDYEGHWNDVMEEYAYAAASLTVTIAYWKYFTTETVAGAGQINSIVARLLLGA